MLGEAAELAVAQGVAPEAALLGGGFITEAFFYRSLAAYLGVAFIEKEASLGTGTRYPHSISAGIAPLCGPGPRWLVAPRGATLGSLLRRRDEGEDMADSLAITTPTNMSRLVRALAAPMIARHASLALAIRYPQLSARGGATEAQCCAVIAAAAAIGLACALAPPISAALAIGAGVVFLAAISLRLFAGAASATRVSRPPRIDDRQLPPYSIIVALHKEARIVRELVAALDAIDYPALGSKLT
ncbi:hypothetical protein CR492_08530 [Methylocella silvestris]|uniref:Uncharacterized protein n=1 Tax=Methylocella silvestris TaxID=199596 RepID=A0A2J7TI62_METSI|nr:hypothetical protein CR492_08530 [Methylocella silvestris]